MRGWERVFADGMEASGVQLRITQGDYLAGWSQALPCQRGGNDSAQGLVVGGARAAWTQASDITQWSGQRQLFIGS